VLDTLALARQMHPGQRNNLDALCKRYSVDNSRRDYHGALLDARLLADVYLAMTGGQAALVLSAEPDPSLARSRIESAAGRPNAVPLLVVSASGAELEAHEQVLALLDKASSGRTVWRTL
jgi:DNA polymerase-3 subunit epsilon